MFDIYKYYNNLLKNQLEIIRTSGFFSLFNLELVFNTKFKQVSVKNGAYFKYPSVYD